MQAAPATPPELPTDAAALQALLLVTMAERDAVTAERDALATRNERLAHLLVQLRRLQFGRKSERLPEDQLQLGLEDTEPAIAKLEAEAERRDPALGREQAMRRRTNRGRLPRICSALRAGWRQSTSAAPAASRDGGDRGRQI